ncbi:MAG TPA: hypothetical protein VMR45_00950 [Patescibacteria group bacterium]|nr:hypothetical protein [Patescibacteria group bacterium]
MGILQLPDGQHRAEVVCVMCDKHIPLSEATAGLIGLDGEQAFACDYHFGLTGQLINGWVDFVVKQKIIAGFFGKTYLDDVGLDSEQFFN